MENVENGRKALIYQAFRVYPPVESLCKKRLFLHSVALLPNFIPSSTLVIPQISPAFSTEIEVVFHRLKRLYKTLLSLFTAWMMRVGENGGYG